MKWQLKPKGEAQTHLEQLIKSGRVTADTKRQDAYKMHPSFNNFTPATFRGHLARTKSAMGSYCK